MFLVVSATKIPLLTELPIGSTTLTANQMVGNAGGIYRANKRASWHFARMKTLQVELPDQMAREVEEAVEAGVFQNSAEVVRGALREFISRRRFELMERQQLEDVAWALREIGR